ncbi:MAG: septum site-determining protein MinC, partial [Clostridiales bacterium]|nr:septum site-determining protein MinC [Clostridiales bacterium]
MSDRDSVYFKATKDNIILMMDSNADFLDIKRSLETKVKQAKKFFGQTSATIAFKGRKLDKVEEAELLGIISRETDLRVLTVAVGDDGPNVLPSPKTDKVVRIDQFANTGANVIIDTPKPKPVKNPPLINSVDTVFHKGNLRSGMSVMHNGSVVIMGDVNPGGEIVAGGNIIVLGTLRGTAHAGAYGNRDSFVAVISLQAAQVCIADIITDFTEGVPLKGKKKTGPSYIYLQNDRMYISP